MVEIGNLAGRKTVAVLTNMSEPLGNNIGNSLEVIEAIETLKGNGPSDFVELCLYLTSEILLVCGICDNETTARQMVIEKINDGSGLKKLTEMIIYQHGDPDVINDYALMGVVFDEVQLKYTGENDVYVSKLDALKIGEAAMLLGAGRETKEQDVDPNVGIELHKKIGDKVSPNDVIATIYTNDKNTQKACELIYSAFEYSSQKVLKQSKIIKIVR
jgi:pyrimidine-nucleoside phosphorylase